jgi:A/G-specific adenine glycosylase
MHDGQIPTKMEALLALPGIGPYTAGAVLSIAFGQDVPALDGNARRVLSRLDALEQDVTKSPAKRRLLRLAESMLPAGRAAEFNQALMDLGATLCTPRTPLCGQCPLAEGCQAHQRGEEERFPMRKPRQPAPHYDVTAGVVWNGTGHFLIAQRPTSGLLGGLWEFPGGKREPGESLEDCLRRELNEELGIEVCVGAPLTVVEHAYTHFSITLYAYHCQLKSGVPQALGCDNWAWVRLRDLDQYAFSAADHKIITALREASV